MRAITLFDGELHFDADYTPRDTPVGLVEVKVLKAGICETDLQLKQGYMGFSGVLGHEFVGVAQSGRFARPTRGWRNKLYLWTLRVLSTGTAQAL